MNPRHRRVGAAVVGAMACSFAACSIGVDFDQYTKGNGTLPDGGPPLTDGAPDGDETDAGFCPDPTAVTLCDDFDGHQDAGWMRSGETAASNAYSVSEPFSLMATMPDVDAGALSGSYLWRYIAPAITTATIEADIKPCAPTRGFTNFLAVLDGTGSFVSIGVLMDGTPKTYAFAGTQTKTTPLIIGNLLPTDRFSHIKWTVVFHPTAGRMTVEVDGEKRIDVGDLTTANGSVTQRAFQVGVSSADGSSCTAYIDNVLVDAR